MHSLREGILPILEPSTSSDTIPLEHTVPSWPHTLLPAVMAAASSIAVVLSHSLIIKSHFIKQQISIETHVRRTNYNTMLVANYNKNLLKNHNQDNMYDHKEILYNLH